MSSGFEEVNDPLRTSSASRLLGREKRPKDSGSWNMFERTVSEKSISSKRPHVYPKGKRTPPLLISSPASKPSLERSSALWWWPFGSVVCGNAARHRTYRLPKRWPLCRSHFLSKLALLLNCHILALDSTAARIAATSRDTKSSLARRRPPAPPRPTFSSIFRSISTLTLCLTSLTHFSRVLLFCLIMLHSTTTAVFSIDDNDIEKGNIK